MKSFPILEKVPFIKYAIAVMLVSLVAIGVALLIKADYLPPEVPLFYGLAEGEEQLSSSNLIILPIVISNTLLILNIGIGFFLKNDFLKKSLIVAGISLVVLSLITTIRIILLVGAF